MDCTLNDPEWKQCCCNCQFHRPTYESCTTNTKLRDEKQTCICGVQNGWACDIPDSKRLHINWPQHSVGCECYTAIQKPVENENHEVPAVVPVVVPDTEFPVGL